MARHMCRVLPVAESGAKTRCSLFRSIAPVVDGSDGIRHFNLPRLRRSPQQALVRTTLMKVGRRRAIDQQAEQLGPAVVAARVHQALALVNPREVRIGDYFAFFRSQRLTHQCAVWRDDRRKATAGDRSDAAAGVLHDLRLLIEIEPGRGVDDEASGLQRMLADVDLHLLGDNVAREPGYIAEWICSPSAIRA
jgi:hypothetical protein